MYKIKEKGFTLIELLVVIAIIGILAGVLFVAINPKEQSDKAKTAIAEEELKQIAEAIYIAKGTNGQTAQEITGSGCSDCICRGGNEETEECKNNWKNAREKISAIDFYPQTNILPFETDPWGIPYGLDENEGENGNCVNDRIRSAGPNRIFENHCSGDDICIIIKNATAECAG